MPALLKRLAARCSRNTLGKLRRLSVGACADHPTNANLDDPVIAVIGAGAVGGYYGARLIQHGRNVHLLTRSGCDSIRRDGMRIRSRDDGDFSLSGKQVNVYDDPRAMPKADLVIVALKTPANDRFAELVGPVVKEDSIILTLQNGLGNEELLGKLFGDDRIIGGVAFVCVNRTGPGEICHTFREKVRLGELRGGPSERAGKIARLFSACGIPSDVLDRLAVGRWGKLIWNVPFNGLGAALDMTTEQLMGSTEGLSMIRSLGREVISACRPLKIRFSSNAIETEIRGTPITPYKTSMQIDRQLGRPMEVEAIIGEPLRIARMNSIETPLLAMLYNMLRQLDTRVLAENSLRGSKMDQENDIHHSASRRREAHEVADTAC
jgi:2-dehydropantoate 2-reductase